MAVPSNHHVPTYGARVAALQASSAPEPGPRSENDDTNKFPRGDQSATSHRTPRDHSHRKPVTTTYRTEKRAHRTSRTSPLTFIRNFTRRTKILIAAGLLALLILIIGLAAGLSHRRASNLPLPSSHGGPYTGDLTYYATGLGACGITSSNGDAIVAVSHLLFDAVQTGTDPNTNPLCGKTLRVQRDVGGRSVDLKVVDRCTGCAARDLDVTEDTFAELANVNLGRVLVRWSWLEDVPS